MTTAEPAIKKKKKRKFSFWWIVLILVVLGVAFLFIRRELQRQQTEEAIGQLETIPFARDTLVSTINGSGTVRAKQSAVLFWQSNGYVGEIRIEVGDEVEADALLMNLDANRLPAEILQAELNKLNAESSLAKLESDTDLQRVKLESDISTAESNLSQLEDQKLAYELRECSQSRLDDLQSAYDDVLEDYETWPTLARWRLVETARQNLAFCDPASIADDLSALEGQIALQEEMLTNYQNELAKIQNGPDPEIQNRLQLQLDLAEKQLGMQEIRAPFAGTITDIAPQKGDLVAPGAMAVQIADLSALYLEVPVSEVDIPKIEVGQSAELIFDAFFEESYQGVVTEIATMPTMMSGMVNYTVTIAMQNGIDKVKPGMTAGVNILTETRENTYVLPAESVFLREGKTYVYVRRDGMPVRVEVKIGAYSSRSVEILQAEIRDGEAVYITPPVSLIESFIGMGGPRGR